MADFRFDKQISMIPDCDCIQKVSEKLRQLHNAQRIVLENVGTTDPTMIPKFVLQYQIIRGNGKPPERNFMIPRICPLCGKPYIYVRTDNGLPINQGQAAPTGSVKAEATVIKAADIEAQKAAEGGTLE